MKNRTLSLALLLAAGAISSAQAQFKLNSGTVGSGLKLAKAATVSDQDVLAHTQEFITWSDANNHVAPASSAYAKRLQKIVANLGTYDGIPLNYKVYLVQDVNAFACADGSVRVMAGLMDLMNDQEILGVIGHEIGHVKHKDSRDAMRTALLASALKDGAASQGGVAGTLSSSQLGDLSQAFANATFSRSQESSADGYGYELLKAQQVNPWYMASAFGKLQALSGGAKSSKTAQMFSSHPDTEKRMAVVSARAEKDGFPKPTDKPADAPTAKAAKTKTK